MNGVGLSDVMEQHQFIIDAETKASFSKGGGRRSLSEDWYDHPGTTCHPSKGDHPGTTCHPSKGDHPGTSCHPSMEGNLDVPRP